MKSNVWESDRERWREKVTVAAKGVTNEKVCEKTDMTHEGWRVRTHSRSECCGSGVNS